MSPREDLFWQKVEHRRDDECWMWTAGLTGAGYGIVSWRENGKVRSRGAHRFAYELLVGPIPDGLHLDHLCRTPRCVNPAHLEPVPPRVNTLRGVGPSAVNATKTACKHGHPFDEVNTRVDPVTGNRSCWTCRRAISAEWNKRESERRLLNAEIEEMKFARTGPEMAA